MKEIYSKPVVEIEEFEVCDVITTSPTSIFKPGTEEGQGIDD